MRLATADVDGRRFGAVVVDAALYPLPDGLTVEDLVQAGLPRALKHAAAALKRRPVPLADAQLLAPLRPSSVRDFVTFESHVEGVRRSIDHAVGVPEAWYDAPTFYFTNPHAIVGTGAPVRRPWGCAALDFELEVACVLGTGGASLTEEQADDAIFGYTILNDWSARDIQSREMQVGLGPAKGKDFCTSIGPWIVTADELADRLDPDRFLDLECTVSVNGSQAGRDRLSHMGWSFATMVAYASRDSLVVPGDVLASGTTGRGGCLAELWGRSGRQEPPPLQPGDVVSITVDRLGTLTNPIMDGSLDRPSPPSGPRRGRPQKAGSTVFEYFPGNYIWNLGVAATLNSGGMIDEVDRACRPIRELATQGSDVGTAEFMASWQRVADQLEEQAIAAEKSGHLRTAGQKYFRAAVYLAQAERMQSASAPGRKAIYQHCLDLMQKSFELVDPATTRVEVPFEGTQLPAYFTDASIDGEPAPVMIMWNGLDSTKEHMYTSGWPAEMAVRGVSVLMVDCPGSGEALRFGGLTSRVETEAWAKACVDYLETRPDVRTDRIGLVGWSLGGYYVPRAAAFEKRLRLVVAWGANHNWGLTQKRRLEREGENPVPHYWEHVLWVWGETDIDTLIKNAERVTLNGVVEQITCAFLITHGENDRQIPVADAYQSYEQAVNSPKRTLRVFTPDEGATEHIGLDHLPHVGAFTADWIEDTLRELDTTS